jgi:hypothetical protein
VTHVLVRRIATALGQKRTNHREPKATDVRCYSNSGQRRA